MIGHLARMQTLPTSFVHLFCCFLSRGDEVMVNREVGHLMRTKSTAHQDGGVSSGRANLDSPFLVDI